MSETNGSGAYGALIAHLRESEVLATATGVLRWDQETMMPRAGAALRAEQLSALTGLVHDRQASPQVGEWLAECEADAALSADPDAAVNLREIRREYDRTVRLPGALVREIAQTTALALQAWRDARECSDFAAFAPWLEKVLELNRQAADAIRTDPGMDRYDVLMDAYEPGASAAELTSVFADLRGRLTPLIQELRGAPNPPSGEVQRGPIPVAAQAAFNQEVAAAIGFDFGAGRLDISTHPFCEGIGYGDTRLTTRYREEAFADSLSSTLHEAGHGLYEQGLPKEAHLGEPLGTSASLGIHESQSRMWENFVGRSRAFWEWATPRARQAFGAPLEGVDAEALYRANNLVMPNLIRVDSDEATYNLHIMLRFDLERALLSGELPVADLPGAWNERIRSDLGIEVPDDRRGCLQDIHWSMGAIGYFPTYTLGNLYAAQLWEAIGRDVPALEERIARGEFGPLLEWLREKVHRHGRRYSATELCERATGAPLGAEPFMRYLGGKLRAVYGL